MVILSTSRGGRGGSEAVYSLLGHAFRREFGFDPPAIERMSHGKPYFPYFPDAHFSLSHTRSHVLCALSASPVGCDIESPRQISSRVMGYYCSPEELAQFDPLDLWVLKESYVKLFGKTIASIRNIRLSRDGEHIFVEQGGYPCASLVERKDSHPVFKLYSVDDCRAAVCGFDHLPDSVELI